MNEKDDHADRAGGEEPKKRHEQKSRNTEDDAGDPMGDKERGLNIIKEDSPKAKYEQIFGSHTEDGTLQVRRKNEKQRSIPPKR